MFSIDDWATLKICFEYIVPATIVATIILIIVIGGLIEYMKFKITNFRHNVIPDETGSEYSSRWNYYKCKDCGEEMYEETSKWNSTPGIIYYKENSFKKCKKRLSHV